MRLLRETSSLPQNIKLTIRRSSNRSKVLRYLYEVCCDFDYSLDTQILAIVILDRFASTNAVGDLQLAGISALFIAAKMHQPTIKGVEDYSQVTANTFNPNQIAEMERNILKALEFNVALLVPQRFFDESVFVEGIRAFGFHVTCNPTVFADVQKFISSYSAIKSVKDFFEIQKEVINTSSRKTTKGVEDYSDTEKVVMNSLNMKATKGVEVHSDIPRGLSSTSSSKARYTCVDERDPLKEETSTRSDVGLTVSTQSCLNDEKVPQDGGECTSMDKKDPENRSSNQDVIKSPSQCKSYHQSILSDDKIMSLSQINFDPHSNSSTLKVLSQDNSVIKYNVGIIKDSLDFDQKHQYESTTLDFSLYLLYKNDLENQLQKESIKQITISGMDLESASSIFQHENRPSEDNIKLTNNIKLGRKANILIEKDKNIQSFSKRAKKDISQKKTKICIDENNQTELAILNNRTLKNRLEIVLKKHIDIFLICICFILEKKERNMYFVYQQAAELYRKTLITKDFKCLMFYIDRQPALKEWILENAK